MTGITRHPPARTLAYCQSPRLADAAESRRAGCGPQARGFGSDLSRRQLTTARGAHVPDNVGLRLNKRTSHASPFATTGRNRTGGYWPVLTLSDRFWNRQWPDLILHTTISPCPRLIRRTARRLARPRQRSGGLPRRPPRSAGKQIWMNPRDMPQSSRSSNRTPPVGSWNALRKRKTECPTQNDFI